MASAYIKDDQGGTFIPASQRPDGTWRKPRRVKDGYVPQEEVPLYESKGKQFQKNKPAHPVGMSAEYVAAHKAKKDAETLKTNPIPGLTIQPEAKKKKKKSKSKSGVASVTEELAKTTITSEVKNPAQASAAAAAPATADQTSAADPLKRLKNLRKKIREIESLDKKIKGGEIKNPDKEMLDKVSRKKEIQQEIKRLEQQANQ